MYPWLSSTMLSASLRLLRLFRISQKPRYLLVHGVHNPRHIANSRNQLIKFLFGSGFPFRSGASPLIRSLPLSMRLLRNSLIIKQPIFYGVFCPLSPFLTLDGPIRCLHKSIALPSGCHLLLASSDVVTANLASHA